MAKTLSALNNTSDCKFSVFGTNEKISMFCISSELQPGSAIEGNIEYNLIEIHAGARVNGKLKQIANSEMNKVQKKLPLKKDKKVEIIGDKDDN